MATHTIADTGYVVLHGHATAPPLVLSINAGEKVSTAHTTVEKFDTLTAAIEKALEVGVSPATISLLAPAAKRPLFNPVDKSWMALPPDLPDWTGDGTYALNQLVLHDGRVWLHISDRQGEPDDTFDLRAMTGDWLPVGYYERPIVESVADPDSDDPDGRG